MSSWAQPRHAHSTPSGMVRRTPVMVSPPKNKQNRSGIGARIPQSEADRHSPKLQYPHDFPGKTDRPTSGLRNAHNNTAHPQREIDRRQCGTSLRFQSSARISQQTTIRANARTASGKKPMPFRGLERSRRTVATSDTIITSAPTQARASFRRPRKSTLQNCLLIRFDEHTAAEN